MVLVVVALLVLLGHPFLHHRVRQHQLAHRDGAQHSQRLRCQLRAMETGTPGTIIHVGTEIRCSPGGFHAHNSTERKGAAITLPNILDNYPSLEKHLSQNGCGMLKDCESCGKTKSSSERFCDTHNGRQASKQTGRYNIYTVYNIPVYRIS